MAIPSGIVIGWPSTAGTIPSGWDRVTALDGKHPKSIPNASTDPGTTGGNAQHSHTTADHQHTLAHTHITGGNTAAAAGTATHSTVAGLDSQTTTNHTHAVGVVASSADSTPTDANSHPSSDQKDNDPARWNTIFIESDGTPTTIPEGAVTFYNNASLPASWTQPANGKDKFLRGAAAAGDGGDTGGGADHTHAGGSHAHASTHGHPSGTTGAGPGISNSAEGAATVAHDVHTHTYTVVSNNFGSSNAGDLATSGNGTAAAAEPPWVKQAIITPPAGGGALKTGIIALWLGILDDIPTDWFLCDGNNDTPNLCQGKFVKGCNLLTELLSTGGNASHTHTGANHTHTWTSSAHTHTLTVAATSDICGATGTATTASSPSHTHATTTSSAAGTLTVGNANPALIASTDNNPLYVEVAFIMYKEPGASYAGSLDTSIDIDVSSANVKKRLRVAISNTGGAAGASAFKLRCSRNGGSYFDVTASSTYVKTFDTTWFADGDDVPQLIDSGTYQADNNAAEDNTGAFTLTAGLAASTKFECEIALEFIKDDLSDNDSLDFRVTQSDNTGLDTYTNTANITITKAGAYTFDVAAGSYSLSGGNADVLAARALDAAAGGYTLGGANAILAKGYFIDLAAGGYALSGANADLIAARVLDSATGSYAISGADAQVLSGRALNADAGGYVISGADALAVAGRAIMADAGSYLLTGQDAALIAARVLNADPGAYVVTGADAILLWSGEGLQNYEFDVEAGVYQLTGAASLVIAGRMLDADAGSYILTGADADKFMTYVLSAEPGTFVITGANALLVPPGAAGINDGDEVQVIQAGGIECMVVTDSETGVRVVIASEKQVTVLTEHETQVKVNI